MPLTADNVVMHDVHDGVTPLDPGHEFRLPTTNRIYNQLLVEKGVSDETCCAHAVATAMETWLVEHHSIGVDDALINPIDIWNALPRRSLRRACDAAEVGVPTARLGKLRATSIEIINPEENGMEFDLGTRRVPLMAEARVDDGFLQYRRSDIYDKSGNVLHGICLIGYGTEEQSGRRYWVAKNSYGDGWGDHGYVRFLRNHPLESVYSLRSVAP